MVIKKNWATYIIWMLSAIVLLINFIACSWRGIKLYCEQFASNIKFAETYDFVIPIIACMLLILVIIPIVYISGRVGEILLKLKNKTLLTEVSGVIIVLAAIGIRIYDLCAGKFGNLTDATYFEYILLTETATINPPVHPIAVCYCAILKAVMRLTENDPSAVMILQIVIQSLIIVFLYLLLKKIAGFIPAVFATMIWGFSMPVIDLCREAQPACFSFLVILTACFVAAECYLSKVYWMQGKAVYISGLSGIVTGCLLYLDRMHLAIVIFVIGMIFFSDVSENYGDKIKNLCVYVITSLLTFLALCGMIAARQGRLFEDILDGWINTVDQKNMLAQILMHDFTQAQMYACFAVTYLALFTVIAFFDQYYVRHMMWMVFLLFVPTPWFHLGGHAGRLITMTVWSVIAGFGIQMALFHNKKENDIQLETVNTKKDKRKTKMITDTEEDIVSQNEIADELVNALAQLDHNSMFGEAEKKDTEQYTYNDRPDIQYIKNPLPLPKKPKHRVMDYEFDVAEEDMKYDYDVDDADEFDL